MYSYYDIDAILAEEELIPLTNLFDFPYLAHLDPEYVVREHQDSQLYFQNGSVKSNFRGQRSNHFNNAHSRLRANTSFYMPLWSVTNWAKAQERCINVKLPKHYRRKTRDRLNSDAVSVDLRSMNERYFMSGILTINLVSKYKARYTTPSSRRSAKDTALLNDLSNEMKELEKCLLLAYTGARLRRIFDWTMSNIDDDVSSFTENLTAMELALFRVCAAATHAYSLWVTHGSRRILRSETALKLMSSQSCKAKKSNVPRGNAENMHPMDRGLSINKRIRV